MATVGVVGPFARADALGPGQSRWVDLGKHDGYGDSSLAVTAMPGHGHGGTTHVLKVDDVNVTAVESHQGDLQFFDYHAGCNVTNTGQTTIDNWAVVVGVIHV